MEKNKDELATTVTPSTQQTQTEISSATASTGNGQKPGEKQPEQQPTTDNVISDNPIKTEKDGKVEKSIPAEVEPAQQTAEMEAASVTREPENN